MKRLYLLHSLVAVGGSLCPLYADGVAWHPVVGENAAVTYAADDTAYTQTRLAEKTRDVMLREGRIVRLEVGVAEESRKTETGTLTLPIGMVRITDEDAEENIHFISVKAGAEYRKYHNETAAKPDWYAYDPSRYVNEKVKVPELLQTENLRLLGQGLHMIHVEETVDMGLGYLLCQGPALYTLVGKGMLLNSGCVVEAGCTLVSCLLSSPERTREWYKSGAGTLIIDGEGDNHLNLMLSGGRTILRRRSGFAACNAYLSGGASLVLEGRSQLQHNLVMGEGGGHLELKGHSVNFDTDFTVSPQNQEALITNDSGMASFVMTTERLEAYGYGNPAVEDAPVLTSGKKGEEKEERAKAEKKKLPRGYAASFRDVSGASLAVVVRETRRPMELNQPSRIILNPKATELTGPGSGLIVMGAMVELCGLPTEPEGMPQPVRARMNVQVCDHGHFTIGEAAELTGTVTVRRGSSFTMAPGRVGSGRESSASCLTGDVLLEDDAEMALDCAEGDFSYAGRISGPQAHLRIQSRGMVCLSHADSELGSIWVSCEQLKNSMLRAREVELIAEKPLSSEWKEMEDGKHLAVSCGTMRGGSVHADSLGITFGAMEGVDDAAYLDITLGTAEEPVQLSGMMTVEVTWGTSRNALKVYSGILTEENGRQIIRVPLKTTMEEP